MKKRGGRETCPPSDPLTLSALGSAQLESLLEILATSYLATVERMNGFLTVDTMTVRLGGIDGPLRYIQKAESFDFFFSRPQVALKQIFFLLDEIKNQFGADFLLLPRNSKVRNKKKNWHRDQGIITLRHIHISCPTFVSFGKLGR